MFAQGDGVNADLVGQHRLVDDLSDDLGVGRWLTGGLVSDIAEGVDS